MSSASVAVPVRVAHLDTAVDPTVVRMADRASTDRTGRLVERVRDGTGADHGTITAAIVTDVAPRADVYSIEVVPGGEVVARLVAGLRWAQACRPHVVCLAVGIEMANRVLDGLIGELCSDGSLVVAAIGNDGAGGARQPALHPHVLAVGACDERGRVVKRSGSVVARATGVVKPDVLAVSSGGTSAACAQVAGVAADIWGRHPGATAGDVRAALCETARPLADDRRHRACRGAIDAQAADAWLGAATYGHGLPTVRSVGPQEPWVDPRLRRRLDQGPDDVRVRAVLLRGTTDVVELLPDELRIALDDPRLRVASATDVSVWTFGPRHSLHP